MTNLFNRKLRRAGAKEPRSQDDIRNEYQQACSAIGDRSFQISILEAQVKELHEIMHKLGREMNLAVEKQKREEAKSAAATSEKK